MTRTLVIVTYGRSGSTVLMNLFNSLPGVFISGENNDALWGLYRSYVAVRNGRNRSISQNLRTDSDGPWYMIDLIQPEEYASKLIELFFQCIVRAPEQAVCRGFKEVRFVEHGSEFNGYLDFLLMNLPNSIVLFNKRDHGAVAKSGWWAHQDEGKVRDRLTTYDTMMDDYAKLRPKRTFVCRYEEWTADPNVLRPVFQRLYLDFDEARLKQVLSTPLSHGKKTEMRQ